MSESGFYAVILAGGKGERFWPLSTSRRPKQLLGLLGGTPLINMAVERLEGLIPPERTLIITSQALVEATRLCAPALPPENVIGEPMGRDTAAACALACALVERRCAGASFCILTADQVMGDLPVYRKTLRESLALSQEKDVLITIGVKPTFPSTGFGYIETAEALEARDGIEFLRAVRFVEKPDEATARAYLEGGRHYWNAGMFVWSVRSLRRAIERHAPHLLPLMARVAGMAGEAELGAVLDAEYPGLKKISVDYALMEKADNIVTVKGAFAWDDVGSWESLAGHVPADGQGNHIIGQCEGVEANGNIVYSAGRLTALIGVKDLVVVQAEGATLICPKSRAQDVKKMVQLLHQRGRYEEML